MATWMLALAQVGVIITLIGLASEVRVIKVRVIRAEAAAGFCGCPVLR